MIKLNELRVTNFILHDRIVNAVIMIGVDSVQLITPQGNLITSRDELIKPIPLTEQWLKDFGFKKIDNKHKDGSISKGVFINYPGVIEVNKLNEGDNPFRFCRSIPSEINEFNFVCFVKYAHHLQNIYRDLFELELTKQ